MAAIFKFQVASVFFQKSNPQGVFTPSLVLVSYFERFAGKKTFICCTIGNNFHGTTVDPSRPENYEMQIWKLFIRVIFLDLIVV